MRDRLYVIQRRVFFETVSSLQRGTEGISLHVLQHNDIIPLTCQGIYFPARFNRLNDVVAYELGRPL